jgi:hypothetical protein
MKNIKNVKKAVQWLMVFGIGSALLAVLVYVKHLPGGNDHGRKMSEPGKMIPKLGRRGESQIVDEGRSGSERAGFQPEPGASIGLGFADRARQLIEEKGPSDALRLFKQMPYGDERRFGIANCLLQISRREGISAALELTVDLGPLDGVETMVTNLFIPKSSNDLGRVLEGLKFVNSERMRRSAIAQIADEARNYEPDFIHKVRSDFPDEPDIQDALNGAYVRSLARINPEKAATLYSNMPGSQQGKAFNEILGNWPNSKSEQGWNWMMDHYQSRRDLEAGMWNLVNKVDSNNLPEVMKLVAEAHPSEAVDQVHGTLVNRAFDQDPSMAREWVKGLQSGVGKNFAMRALLTRMVERDPREAVDFAAESALGAADLANNLSTVGRLWGARDPENALEWLESESVVAPNMESQVRNSIINSWVTRDPRDFIGQSKENPDFKMTRQTADILLQSLGRKSPQEAVEWLVGSEFATPDRVGATMREWIRFDPMAASKWARSLEPGETRRIAVESIVEEMEVNDPESAEIWKRELK